MIAFPDDKDNFGATIQEFPSDGLEEPGEEESGDEEGDVVILGKGTRENLMFEWKTTPWSACSQTCGGNGYQFRTMRCVVRSVSLKILYIYLYYFLFCPPSRLYNATQGVDSNLCDDAGLELPKTRRKCGFDECPQWNVYKWTPCERSKCFAWHKGE